MKQEGGEGTLERESSKLNYRTNKWNKLSRSRNSEWVKFMDGLNLLTAMASILSWAFADLLYSIDWIRPY